MNCLKVLLVMMHLLISEKINRINVIPNIQSKINNEIARDYLCGTSFF